MCIGIRKACDWMMKARKVGQARERWSQCVVFPFVLNVTVLESGEEPSCMSVWAQPELLKVNK